MGQTPICACISGTGQEIAVAAHPLHEATLEDISFPADTREIGGNADTNLVEEVDSKHVHNMKVVRPSHAEGDNTDDYMELTVVDWIDWFVRQLWPHCEKVIQNIVKTKIEPNIDKELEKYGIAGRAFMGVKFTRCELGDKRPELGPVRMYRRSHQDFFGIEIDCDMRLDCEPRIEMTIGGMVAGIKRLKFEGTVSVVMKPLVERAPIIGGAQMFLMNTPTLDFELAGALDAVNATVIHNVLKNIVLEQMTQSFVLPTRVHKNILKEWQLNTDMVSLLSPLPEGIVRVQVVSASNLPASDIHLEDFRDFKEWMSGNKQTLGTTSDPYCEVQIGAAIFQTETVERTVNPIWTSGATGDFLVYNLAQFTVVRIFDNDFGLTKNDFLGSATITVEELIRSKAVTIPIEFEPDATSKDGENAKIATGRKQGKTGGDMAFQQSHVCLRAEYFELQEPSGVDDFARFRAKHDGPSEALLGVKIFGLRSIGHRSSASDVVGKIVRATLHSRNGSTTSFSSKPSRLHVSHVEMDGVDASALRIVWNLRSLNPGMPLEAIAAATELEPCTVKRILDMNALIPVQVNAGFFFCINSHEHDICFVELLPTKKAQTAIASFQVPISQVVATKGMILRKSFIVHPGQFDPVREQPTQEQKGTPGDAVTKSHTSAWDRVTSPLTNLITKTSSSDVEGNRHRDPQAKPGDDHRSRQNDQTVKFGTETQIEITMELRMYSMV